MFHTFMVSLGLWAALGSLKWFQSSSDHLEDLWFDSLITLQTPGLLCHICVKRQIRNVAVTGYN